MCYTIFVGVYPIYYKLEGITMYYIYTCFYRSVLPVTSPLDVAEWFEPDEAVEFSSDVLDDVIEKVKKDYCDKVYRNNYNDSGSDCFLCYIIDDTGYIVGYVDFDKTVCILEKKMG